MIESIFNPIDTLCSMPYEQQFHWAAGLSAFGFAAAAFLREAFQDSEIRLAGRALGLASFVALFGFSWSATNEIKELNSELMVRHGGKNAEEIADQISVVAVEKEYSVEVAKGIQVNWTKYGDGRTGSVSIGNGCSSIDVNSDCGFGYPASTTGVSIGAMPTGEPF